MVDVSQALALIQSSGPVLTVYTVCQNGRCTREEPHSQCHQHLELSPCTSLSTSAAYNRRCITLAQSYCFCRVSVPLPFQCNFALLGHPGRRAQATRSNQGPSQRAHTERMTQPLPLSNSSMLQTLRVGILYYSTGRSTSRRS